MTKQTHVSKLFGDVWGGSEAGYSSNFYAICIKIGRIETKSPVELSSLGTIQIREFGGRLFILPIFTDSP